MRKFALVFVAAALVACSGPKDTVVPKEIDKMDTIKPSLDKLTTEERELFAGYAIRHTLGAKMGALFGVKDAPAGIPDGMTIGKAIDEQRKFKADKDLEAAKAEENKKKIEAERAAKQAEFAKLVAVTVLGKKNNIGEYEQRFVSFDVVFENHTDKDVLGVKGLLKVNDIFGDKVTYIRCSFDKGISAKGGSTEKSTGVKVNQFDDDDMKLWNADTDKLKYSFEILKIVFKDGTTVDAPE